MEEVEIVIDENGTVNIDLLGFKGQECSKVLDELTRILGKPAKVEQKTEYYQEPGQKQSQDHRL